MKVLIADDDRDLLDLIAFTLSQAGYLPLKATDGNAALALFESEGPDLLVLDINMPGASGFKVCESIRTRSAVPIMMLTARNEEEDLVRSLELGADDYLTKPFSPRTLVARVKALLRRSGHDSGGQTQAGDLSLDPDLLTLRIADREIKVTPLESRLLQLLLANAGQVVHTDRLLVHVWGHRGGGDRQLLKQLIHRLRQKIGDDPEQPRWLSTIPSVGYKLQATEKNVS
jgi:DNA-binding response OmpR family regulator